jgi:hypothetical protein
MERVMPDYFFFDFVLQLLPELPELSFDARRVHDFRGTIAVRNEIALAGVPSVAQLVR